MTRKKANAPLSFPQTLSKLRHAGISENETANRQPVDYDAIPDLSARVKKIIGLVNRPQRPAASMLCFVMYDIESNKVRHQVSRYLLRAGCFRVQRSVFLADLSTGRYDMIRRDLAEVQSLYDNQDSILIVPVSVDYLQAMKIIGKSIDIDVIMKSKNTLFF